MKWEKKVAPAKVRIDLLNNAIGTLNTHLTGIVTNFQISPDEKWAIEQKNEPAYWGALVGRLGRALHHCHIVLEQAFVVIDHLAVATDPKDHRGQHNLHSTYEAFGEELKRDFHDMLASAGVDIGETREGVRKWLEWAQKWRSIGTYHPEGLSEDRVRQYGKVSAAASDYAFAIAAIATAEIGDQTSLISIDRHLLSG